MNRTDSETGGHTSARFILTNRMNLHAMLSSRIIGPRTFFTKYYQDLLDLGSGSVPVLSEPPASDLVDVASASVQTGPALLEIMTPVTNVPQAPVDFVESVPMAAVTAIHLPSDASLREYRARKYRNIHPHDNILNVTPALFTGTVNRNDVVQAFDSQKRPAPRDAETWRRIDRVRGALSACIAAADDEATLRRAASVIDKNVLVSSSRFLSLLNSSRPRELNAADRALTAAALEIVINNDVKDAWNPVAIIDRIRSTVSSDDVTARIIAANLNRVSEIVTARVPFTPFRQGGRGLTSAKALLLVLLREDLAELLAWPPTETGADPNTRQLAAIFAGALRGLSRETTSVRSLTLDDLTARWACSNNESEFSAVNIAVVAKDDKMHLTVDGRGVRSVRSTDTSTL
ncbi:hypothetical protein HH310_22010 [Actinoplanes sp. TBRC 11911]|uniref:hypothetical protein n=1 Tax=Actinoplanes sp. TBRC 11911 TaxID=2729386 RepID=UPI00145FA54D|nr:hypothetical protein [Actinoplanes sp. TBRC 11911]NMO53845.1 hypothetical protein [Actinoplanes sp. TBRC 11911]